MSAEFVDSNVLVYAHDPTTPAKHERARALIERLWIEKTGRLSIQVMQEFFWIVTRKIPAPLPRETALAVLADLSLWPIYSPAPADVLAAGRLAGEVKISFWDAMLLVAAKASKAKRFWSEDLAHGQFVEGVQIFNPFLEGG
jgi:predicted nucleic acid-binding protein